MVTQGALPNGMNGWAKTKLRYVGKDKHIFFVPHNSALTVTAQRQKWQPNANLKYLHSKGARNFDEHKASI